ncbi:hypothetical protein P5667_11720 [Bacillus velezensis]|uniref:hypothetical protein n=1 Tax=Bacillus velezensis TaxID=492670 RepID=UPI002798D0D6|nr:hypothetical protein [Bacillus velezensis]WEY79791.1 hypothetical protein P5667_11720 [Bacillus velezensis]
MYEYKIAYRFDNSEVQGFIGIGFTKKSAQENAIRKIENKLGIIGENYNNLRVIKNKNNISHYELKQIKKDWKKS